MSRTIKRRNKRTTPKTKSELVAYAVAVGRVITALHAHNAYSPARCASVLQLSEDTCLSMEDVVDAAAGLITRKYAVIHHQSRDLDFGGYFLASASHVEDYAGFLRERARDIQHDANRMDRLAKRLDYDETVTK